MKKYHVNLFGLSNSKELFQRIDAIAWDTYIIAGKPDCYEVIWNHQESISALIPELPANRITEPL